MSTAEPVPASTSPGRVAPILAALLLAALFLPGFIGHARYGARPEVLADDARQQAWPIECFAGQPQFCDDYPARFYLDSYPLGFTAVGHAGLTVLTAQQLSDALPYVLLAAVIGLLAWAVARVEGWGMAALTVVMVCMTDEYLARMAGGIPRAFGYPVLALAYAGLLLGRPWLLAAAAVAGALFHPPMGLLCGLLLAALQLLDAFAPRLTGSSVSVPLVRRAALVVGSGAVCVALLVPVLRSSAPYGPVISRERLPDYPELGTSGRYSGEDSPIRHNGLIEDAVTGAMRALANHTDPVAVFVEGRLPRRVGSLARLGALALLGVGAIVAARRRPHVRRLLLVVPVAVLLYILASLLWPRLYQPQRYVGYAVPPLVAVLMPMAFRALAELVSPRGRRPAILAAVGVGTLTLLVGGLGPGRAGLGIVVPPDEMTLLDAIGRLPATAVIAGWPGNVEPIESVPMLASRRAFVTYETHQIFHQQYGLRMRERMFALTDAYVTASPEALATLRDGFGVTHLLVDRRRMAALDYFEPFDSYRHRIAPPPAETLRRFQALAPAAVYATDRFLLLDLQRLPPVPAAAPGSAGS